MPTLGLPTPMFLIFVATVIAGSLGAVHYVIVHVILGRPFAEIPPPVLREEGEVPPPAPGSAGSREGVEDGRDGGPGSDGG